MSTVKYSNRDGKLSVRITDKGDEMNRSSLSMDFPSLKPRDRKCAVFQMCSEDTLDHDMASGVESDTIHDHPSIIAGGEL